MVSCRHHASLSYGSRLEMALARRRRHLRIRLEAILGSPQSAGGRLSSARSLTKSAHSFSTSANIDEVSLNRR